MHRSKPIPAELSSPTVEALYTEALLLADEARFVFDRRRCAGLGPRESKARAVEGMKTTTRILNMIAWLLAQRAFLAGELSEHQLREQGDLRADRRADEDYFRCLDAEARSIIRQSELLHKRLTRLHEARPRRAAEACPAHTLQHRVGEMFAS
jgi:regulator of CtrA degradation